MALRICIDGRYIQDHFPGIGRYTYNLIAALAQIAPEEKFVVLHNPGVKNTRFDLGVLERYPNLDLVRVEVPVFSLQEQFRFPNLRLISGQISNLQFLHSPYFVKPFFLRVPSIVTIFDLIPLHYPDELPNALSHWLFRVGVSLAARTSQRILVPSRSACEDLVASLHVAPEKLAVTSLAADARFKRVGEPEIARIRDKYSLPDRYVLYVGINKPHKNLERLIAAWERTHVEAALVIAGAWDKRYGQVSIGVEEQENQGAGKLRRIIYLHDLPEEDLPALYSAATVFVFPSLYEGFGLPLLEAMACGAPVISSNASSLPEVGGDAPVYFNPHDADALAQQIAQVTNDRALQDDLRGRSLARAKEFSWERTAQATLEVYRSIGGA